MTDWQTIDTAPMDGTVVLVADVFGVSAAAFDGPPTREEYEDIVGEKVSDEDWAEEVERYQHAWISKDPISGDCETMWPSHWAPLPKAPEAASLQAQGGRDA